MLSLRTFHLGFILLAIIGADLFGIWSVWYWANNREHMILFLGILSLLGGLGLTVYAIRLVRSLDRAGIH